MIRKIFLAIHCLILSATAQQPLQFLFTHYTTSSGLISNQVNSIVQDGEGYLWMGTTDGLQRFDGIRYKTFQHKENDSTSIPSNPVWQLLVDKKKNLWILLADGRVGKFNTRSFTFHEVPARFKKPVSPDTFVKHLIADEYGNVFYLMGGTEVITWDEKSNEFSFIHNFFKQKQAWDIADFIQQPGTHKYWISIVGGGLAVYDGSNGTLSYPGQNIGKERLVDAYAGSNSYYHLFFDRQNRLWSFTLDGSSYIYCYDLKNEKTVIGRTEFPSFLKPFHKIEGFMQQEDGNVWIYGQLVFAKFLETNKQFQFVSNGYQSENSIVYEVIHCLFEDREHNVWVTTDNNGLYRFNRTEEFFTNFSHQNRVSDKKGQGRLMSFISTKSGTILSGSWMDGLYQYDSSLNLIPTNIKGIDNQSGPNAWGMYASKDSNTIWISSQPGIYAIDQAKRTSKYYNPPELSSHTIRQIAEDGAGNLWLGTDNKGVYKWAARNGKIDFSKGPAPVAAIPEVQINKITIDSKGQLWIATPETGLFVIDPVSDKVSMHFSNQEKPPFQLPESGISSVLEYDDSTMIISTATHVVKYNRITNDISAIGRPGIISGFIAAVEKDREGYLWLASTNGLYRINIQKGIMIIFSRLDGIENEQFTQSASLVLPDGRMLFGTTNHFIAFDPNHSEAMHSYPDLHITGFKMMGKSLSVDSLMRLREIELSFQDNAVEIEFSTLMYGSPFLIKYKLEGLDKDWKPADKNNQAVYNYLPPGSYTFLLRALDAEGNESGKTSGIKIIVNAPFWKTIWFYSLLILAIGGFLFWLDRQRMQRKEAIQKMRSDIANNLHQEVNIALGNINILSEMANLKAGKEPQKSKEFIEQIHSKSKNMMAAMDDMLWSINPENDSMAKAIERITEHVDALRNSYGVKINLLVDKKVEALKLNMKTRKNIFWLFKSGSNNIVRTGATDCNIHISVQRQNLVYILEFNTSQMDTQQMNNLLQRQELANKLEEVNGILRSQLQNKRSTIELTIPLS
ncbi:MAG TPA: two-component regulator propeller domain-containing protein [Puia sp.]|nr:two-component regulator propeller domain-containing protein [Puia sp.]